VVHATNDKTNTTTTTTTLIFESLLELLRSSERVTCIRAITINSNNEDTKKLYQLLSPAEKKE